MTSLAPVITPAAFYISSAISIAAFEAIKYNLWSKDQKADDANKDDRGILDVSDAKPDAKPGDKPDAKPGDKPGAKPGAQPSKEQIVLPQGFDIKNYRIQDLKTDRSFIRAFYFIRFKENPTDEQLNTFVQTDVIDTFNSDANDSNRRIFSVMHYLLKNEQAPYITFCKIRTNAFKVTSNKLITIEDLLNVSQISDNMFRRLNTKELNVSRLLEIIKEIRGKNEAFLTLEVSKQQKLMDQYAVIKTTDQPDNSALELFKTLSTLIRDKKMLRDILVECLKDECKNLSQNKEHKANDLRYKDFIKTLSNNKNKGEVNFPYRCGVGDLLAEAKTKVCVTYVKGEGEEKQYHNYGCDDRNSVYPNNYIIYMYKDHHCVLLIPKSIKEKSIALQTLTSPTSVVPKTKIINDASPTSVVPKTKIINDASTIQNPCVKHDKLFLEGGTRKHRNSKNKFATKNRKSQRKGTRII
jgi:hypothetical protein